MFMLVFFFNLLRHVITSFHKAAKSKQWTQILHCKSFMAENPKKRKRGSLRHNSFGIALELEYNSTGKVFISVSSAGDAQRQML